MKRWKDVRPQIVTDEARVAAHREQLEAELSQYTRVCHACPECGLTIGGDCFCADAANQQNGETQ